MIFLELKSADYMQYAKDSDQQSSKIIWCSPATCKIFLRLHNKTTKYSSTFIDWRDVFLEKGNDIRFTSF